MMVFGGYMRITVLDDDPGVKVMPGVERFRVTVDGEEIVRCLTADDVDGEIVEVATDAKGNIEIENGEVKTRIWKGVVIIQKVESSDKG
ncbi:hypothetical protein [Pantoea sp. aB]|uniref:hypothetical protein n=1 Tax=Pantoea sp. aB TaxID=517433 RepID=UPI0001E0DF61|nr:hypothetical protein [Pantoea sp. aB]EFM20573.1 conserved hypothetical protein [Pantoea sp. aB]